MLLPTSKLKRFLIAAIPLVILLTGVAWVDNPLTPIAVAQNKLKDTVPGKSNKIYDDRSERKDIDQRLDQMEKAIEQLNSKLKEKEWEKMEQKLEAALGQIDMEKVQKQIDEAMKKVDMNKIRLDADAAMKKINWEKIQQEIKSAMAEANDKTTRKNLEKELQEAMKEARKGFEEAKKIDYEKIKQQLEKSKEQWQKEKVQIQKQLEEAKEQMSKSKVDMKLQLEKARKQTEYAKEELQSYKTMIGDMEKDGLLNSKEDYSIDFKNGELFINGTKQSPEITAKYKPWFKKGNAAIKKEKGNFSLHNDE